MLHRPERYHLHHRGECLLTKFRLQNFSLLSQSEESAQVQFSMALKNVELVHEHHPQHLRRGTTRMKSDKEKTDE